MNKFWNFVEPEQPEQPAELYFKGPIAEESWFGDEITPQLFRDELSKVKGDLTVYINSPGGDCFAASEIYSMLMEHHGNVTVKIDALAASAASVIAMAGGEIHMAPTAVLMIHNPATMACGDHNDMRKAIDILDSIKESIINAYELKTGLSRAKISRMMEDETWMHAGEAVKLGFADCIIGGGESPENSFSIKQCEDALVGKIVAQIKQEAPKGVPVEPLLAALECKQKLFERT